MIDKHTQKALKVFFDSTDILISKKIIRSSKYTADVAEFLSQKIYDLTLCENQREVGFDGEDDRKKRYQIKINNSTQKTNQHIGNIEYYDFLILMITCNSRLFDAKFNKYFITVYKIEKHLIPNSVYIAKTFIYKMVPEYLITENFEIIRNNYERNSYQIQ